jgi:hypothetical protein
LLCEQSYLNAIIDTGTGKKLTSIKSTYTKGNFKAKENPPARSLLGDLINYLYYQPRPQTTDSKSLAVLFRVSAIEISAAEAVPEAFSPAITAVVSLISLFVLMQSNVTQVSLLAAAPRAIGLFVQR